VIALLSSYFCTFHYSYTTVEKFGISKEINTFFLQLCIKSIKSHLISIYKNYISNKCCSYELSIYQRILKKMSIVSTTVDNIKNNFLSSNSAYKNISEGSHDTE